MPGNMEGGKTFYGPYEIEEAAFDGDSVTLTLKDREEKIVTSRKGLEEAASDEPLDLGKFRERRYKQLLGRLAEKCLESSISYEDIPWVAQRLGENLVHSYSLAIGKRFGRSVIPGMDPLYGMTLREVENILQEGKNESANGGTSEGEGAA